MSIDYAIVTEHSGKQTAKAAFGLKAALYAAEGLHRQAGGAVAECRVEMEDGTILRYDGQDWRGEKP